MKIEAGDESLASFFLSIIYKKDIKNVLTNTIPGVKMRPRSGSDPENMEGKKMATYKQYIGLKKAEWIGKKVIYSGDNEVYTVVDVDYNGALLIDKPARFTDTTAVALWMVQEVE